MIPFAVRHVEIPSNPRSARYDQRLVIRLDAVVIQLEAGVILLHAVVIRLQAGIIQLYAVE